MNGALNLRPSAFIRVIRGFPPFLSPLSHTPDRTNNRPA